MARTAEDLHSAAVELVNRGRVAAARRMLSRAAVATDDPNLRARIAGTWAYALSRIGELGEAERICAEALRTPGLDRHTGAILAGQMGALAERAGRLEEAERWLGRGIDGLADDPQARANLLVNRSLVNMQRRQLGRAAVDAAAATEVFRALGLTVDEAQARHNEGYIALLEGDIVTAMRQMGSAREVLAPLSAVSAAVGDADRAEVLRDAGLTTEAERILSRNIAVFGAHRMPQSRAETEFNLARSQLLHDPVKARRAAASAARRFRAVGNDAWAVRAEAVRLRAQLAGGAVDPGGDAVPRATRVPSQGEVGAAAAALDSRGFRNEAAALRMSYELWAARTHGSVAEPRAARAPRTASMDVRLLSYEVRAAMAAASGRHGTARRHAAAGLDELARWQRSFGSLDLQTSAGMHAAGLVFAGLDSAARSGRPDVLFEWSERARHLSQQVVPLRPPPDPELAAELAELRQLRADNPHDDWLSNPRAAELRDRARQRQWAATGSAAIQERIDLDGLRASLDSETALIAYVYSGRALVALVVTAGGAKVMPLRAWPAVQRALPGLRADLDMSASIRSGPMAEVVRRSLDERLGSLSAALLDGPGAAAGVRRLVITVPGVLNGIPWAMLPAMRGRAFTLAVSATRWASLRDAASRAPVTAGFAVGPRVARGDEEVDAAASAWPPSRTLRAAEATVDAVTDLASQVELLHIAAHGRHAVDNPLFSGLELADGALFGYDIDRMPRPPSTVVLSACEVGRSSVRWGEEAIGMTRIWLHAGTRAVVATPVVVADDEACELLGAMHAELAAGLPAAEALAAASGRTGIVAPFQTHGSGF
ncbi:CHAT domain-containing protein [Microbacterium rhizomatis]|uniref:CHAT domain-containing protein n=1 Tax=Microbacterium rhizomatis TaxID=1631477 RepID=A0A5J5IZP2_9MICO|nr:CHAT domain-containing protein [Microbacterium rhizomatis]KAA9107882.1 CHAT domain-containing protein [Microbacterium rhizomatis]